MKFGFVVPWADATDVVGYIPYVQRIAPRDGLTLMRAKYPGIKFYRFLYHSVGEEFLWGDRRRMSDADLIEKVDQEDVHVVVLYEAGVPAGFFELNFHDPDVTNINYFGLMPGFIGRGLGSYLLGSSITYAAGARRTPLTLDTCSLDHSSALENYRRRGFELIFERDEEYPDPRLDGTIRKDAGQHVPLAV